jgi:hypothetical protein
MVLTLPLLFFTTVIFTDDSVPVGYFFAAGGSSRIHGQTAIVLTLPLVFLMTVIFMSKVSD